MFARVKKSGKYEYLQIVENSKVKGKVKQRVISTLGRMDRLKDKDRIEPLVRSLSRFSDQALLILSGKSDVSAKAKIIGPALIFERLWKQTGIQQAIQNLLNERNFEFDIERAIFLTVLHRLMESGSDRSCNKWHRDYIINGVQDIELHHLYRAMAFLGEELKDQSDSLPFSPRCNKDLVEESLFSYRRDLFSGLELVFFDTTSIYFEGSGGDELGKRGYSKDHRPDLKQMIVGAVIDDKGCPICCEMWPGNVTDVKTILPVINRLKKRFHIGNVCIVADRGMISKSILEELKKPGSSVSYILGARMRNVKEIRESVLSRPGRYKEVRTGDNSKDNDPLKVKEVKLNETRYILCFNPRQARKDAQSREATIESLHKKIKDGASSLVGNKGYRKYVKIEKGGASIDEEKIKRDARFDGKWVLNTNTNLSSDKVALKYKELWQVERIFRDVKTLLETRPIFHQRDNTIRGHVFCSFLALVMRKELDRRLDNAGYHFEWADIKQDLRSLSEVTIEESGKRLAVRSRSEGICGKVFQSVGVAMPATIREL